MKQKDKNQKLTGAEGFHTYYSGIFGERWESLKKSLFLEPDHVQFNAGGKEPYFLDSASVPYPGETRKKSSSVRSFEKSEVYKRCADGLQ